MSTNPYVSPIADCSPVDTTDEECARGKMLGVIRLYWWMGLIGCAVYSVCAIGMCVEWSLSGASSPAGCAMGLFSCILAVATFGYSIRLANRLATRPRGLLGRARLVGIILATAWFPILTIPGIICVRRVTRYHAVYCDSTQHLQSPP